MARSAIFALLIALCSFPARAVDLLYVSMQNNTVRIYDISKTNPSDIEASGREFVTTNLFGNRGLAFDSSGNLFVANQANNTISKFDSNGVFQANGSISSNLNAPIGLKIDQSDNIYVANAGLNQIQKFDSSGNPDLTINGTTPRTIALDKQGNIFASNGSFWSNISKYNSQGTLVSTFGSYPTLKAPMGMTVDSSGNLFVANMDSTYITILNSTGGFIKNLEAVPQLLKPTDVLFDSLGNLYATYESSKRIAKFDPSGNYVLSWSTGSVIPQYLAIIPEPSTIITGLISLTVIVGICKQRSEKSES